MPKQKQSQADLYEDVVKHYGSATAMASELGEASVAVIVNWRTRGIPANKAKAIEAATGISVKRLRPDDWHKYWPELAEDKVGA